MPRFLCVLLQTHEEFRIPELRSIADYFKYDLEIEMDTYSHLNPFVWVHLPSEEAARRMLERLVLTRYIFRVFAEGSGENAYEEIKKQLTSEGGMKELMPVLQGKGTYAVGFQTHNKKGSMSRQRELRNQLKEYIPFEGMIDLKTPDRKFVVIEGYALNDKHDKKSKDFPECVYFALELGEGQKKVNAKYDLKKRDYIGTTSMDAFLSIIMGNMGHCGKGRIMYDPFVGTGSLLVGAAHYGSYTCGSDIDPRVVRGKNGKSIKNHGMQYNMNDRILDVMIADNNHSPFRMSNMFHCILTDPPYGIREEAKKLGPKPGREGVKIVQRHDHIPQTVKYELPDILNDLLDFAAKSLVIQGRLVYWIPVYREDYDPSSLPKHPCLEVLADSEQALTMKWARRLITMKKVREYDPEDAEVVLFKQNRCKADTAADWLFKNLRARLFEENEESRKKKKKIAEEGHQAKKSRKSC
eukprot:Nk52_evm26s240 gene=Nk52_evmTU26s240